MGHTMEKWVNACGHQIPHMSIHVDVQDVQEQDKGEGGAISHQQMFGLVVCVSSGSNVNTRSQGFPGQCILTWWPFIGRDAANVSA